jgi:hypothetical protein
MQFVTRKLWKKQQESPKHIKVVFSVQQVVPRAPDAE